MLAAKANERNMSMRAFARVGGLSHSYLSRVVSGKRHLSLVSASKISQILDMSRERAINPF